MEFGINTTSTEEVLPDSKAEKSERLAGDEFKNNTFPQYLCRTCGRCCKSITTAHTPEELKKMTAENQEEARVFIDIFKKYESIEDAKKVVPEQIEQVLQILSEKEGFNESETAFYYCPHIMDNGLCGIYEKRPNCCKRAPNHGWSAMPPGCGFEGWQFEQKEYQKKLIRTLKEYLFISESISTDGKVPGKDMKIDELKKIIDEKIEPWKRFGAEYW